MKSKKQILNQIGKYRDDIDSLYGTPNTKLRNNIRLLQWALGIRTRPYPEGEGLMQKEDQKALKKENELRKKLKEELTKQ